MTGSVPRWLEQWFGLAGSSGEGVAWRLTSRWPWPTWGTLVFLLLAAALIVAVYLREARHTSRAVRLLLAAIRITLVVMVLGMIAQWELLLQRTGLPCVALVIDDTRSLGTEDNYSESTSAALAARLSDEPSASPKLSRWNLLKTLLNEHDGAFLKGLAESHKLRLFYVTGNKESQQSEIPKIIAEINAAAPLGDETCLGTSIRSTLDALRGSTPVAMVLLTDGINTAGPSLIDGASEARRRSVPLFFVGLGSDRPVRDLALSDLLVEDIVFVGDVVNFRCKLTGLGFQGEKVRVVVRQEGRPGALAHVDVTVAADGQPQDVQINYRPKEVGQFRFLLDVEAPPGGLQTKHAPLAHLVQVRKEKIRVLLVQGYPSYEYRFLSSLLRRDETIDLHTVLQEADMEYVDQDKAALRVFPVRRDELFAYDVVILGDVDPAQLGSTAVQNLADFVDSGARENSRGGALVCWAGSRYMPQAFRDTPLERLLPVDLAQLSYPPADRPLTMPLQIMPTDLGLANPAMQLAETAEESLAAWRNLPPLYWLVDAAKLKPGARVLAQATDGSDAERGAKPAILLQYVGSGKVLFHCTDETWRWRRGADDASFARYWVQMLRFLARSKLAEGGHSVRLTTDKPKYMVGDRALVRVRFADERTAPADDDGATIMIERPGSKSERLKLHRQENDRTLFEATLGPLVSGGYHALLATPALEGRPATVDFIVAPPPGELANVQMDAPAMRRAAELTLGRYYSFLDAQKLLQDIPQGRPAAIEDLQPQPLWNRWPVLAIFLSLLIVEWLLRKRQGMA